MAHFPDEIVVGSMMCEMVYTWSNIAIVVGVLIRYMKRAQKDHFFCQKYIQIFVWKKWSCYVLHGGFEDDNEVIVQGFIIANSTGDLDRRRSIIRYVFKQFDRAIYLLRMK